MPCTTTIFTRYDQQCKEFEAEYNFYLKNDNFFDRWKLQHDSQKYKEMGAIARFHEKVAILVNDPSSQEGVALLGYLKTRDNYQNIDSQPLIGFSDQDILNNFNNRLDDLKNNALQWFYQQTKSPTSSPTEEITASPTLQPTTNQPTIAPSQSPTSQPTFLPTINQPTIVPSHLPTPQPNSSGGDNNPNDKPVTGEVLGTLAIVAVCIAFAIYTVKKCRSRRRVEVIANDVENDENPQPPSYIDDNLNLPEENPPPPYCAQEVPSPAIRGAQVGRLDNAPIGDLDNDANQNQERQGRG